MSDSPLVTVRNLTKHYPITEGILRRETGRTRAVDGIDFEIGRGETVGLVGESGCGKSTAGRTMLRLEEPTAGEVRFDGDDLFAFDAARLKRFRREAQMIFQDPVSSLDPRMAIGESVAEPLRIHGMHDRDRRRAIVGDLLERVGMSQDDIDRYPHEFSGGQKQRIALARALSVNPRLLVADEPVSALDVSVQAEILSLIKEIQDEHDLAVLFISHDMSVVREVCDRVAVMYLGEIVEYGDADTVFERPQHPYTRALLASVLPADPAHERERVTLSGAVPDPSAPPEGCRFHTRCPEIIPPDEYDFDPDDWRSVMDLRSRLDDAEFDLETIRDFAAERVDGDPTAETLQSTIRDSFDIPESLSDPRAETELAAALEELAAGDETGAARRLREAFPTPCRRHSPELQETKAGAPAACHLHDRDIAADERAEPRDVGDR